MVQLYTWWYYCIEIACIMWWLCLYLDALGPHMWVCPRLQYPLCVSVHQIINFKRAELIAPGHTQTRRTYLHQHIMTLTTHASLYIINVLDVMILLSSKYIHCVMKCGKVLSSIFILHCTTVIQMKWNSTDHFKEFWICNLILLQKCIEWNSIDRLWMCACQMLILYYMYLYILLIFFREF